MKQKNLFINIASLFMIVIMLISIIPSKAMADDDIPEQTEALTYNLNVYLPKNTVGDISFYPTTGFDEENHDIFSKDSIISYDIDSEADAEYDIYKMPVTDGTYSFRATDNDGKSLGGGVINIPSRLIVENSEVTAYLRLSKTYITNKYEDEKATAEDFSVTLFNKFGTVTMGDSFTDEKGYCCYPALIWADGNSLLYYVTATPSENYEKLHNLKEERNNNIAVFKNDKIQNFKLTLSQKIPFKIIAPSDAEVCMYNQILNFNTIKILPVNITDNEDGTCSYEFSSAGDSYRVSMEGKRTQAGYISQDIIDEGAVLNITFPEGSVLQQTEPGTGRKESGVLLNINERNNLSLAIGESYKVRAYRAPWQIINTDTDNIIIEPDFHFNVLSGDDVIDISQTDDGKGNWAEITAINNGVSIVEVTYDAIDVAWSNKTELYGATNPGRTGVFAVTVGDNYKEIPGIDIDSEYHTEYFTGECGYLTVSPEGSDVCIEVAGVRQGALGEWKTVTCNEGVFKIPLSDGNNILKITSDGICDFRVVRASKLEAVITNKTNPDRTEEVLPGDELSIGFKGLYQWIPKFAGIYNPSRLYAVYQLGDNIIESKKSQYSLPETTLDITVPPDTENYIILNNGRLTGNTLGSVWSAHRQLTDAGVPANFNASTLPLEDLTLPDLIIPVAEPLKDSETGDEKDYDDIPSSGDDDSTYEPENNGIDVSDLKFDISKEAADGYVTVSFTDKGERKPDESGVTYETPLGEIIKAVKVPFKADDTIPTVTLRLLKALNITPVYTGKSTNNFYLSAIGDFTLNGKFYESFGEFDAGAASGWMVKHNNWFINMGASEFAVKDGDVIEWLYTCRLGADIGCDWSNPSAEITGITFKSDYGTLSPSFRKDIREYTYSVSSATKSICISAEAENLWSKITYTSGGKTYNANEEIPVSDGTVIILESAFSEFMGHTPTDTDSLKITIKKNNGGTGIGSASSPENSKEPETEADKIQEKPSFSETTFTDVKKEDWYYNHVKYVYENNLMEGTGEQFEPNKKLSRAMLVTVLFRMANPKTTGYTHSFSDVLENQWYSDALSWAASEEIVAGISDTEFAPNNDLSREQMAVILYRFAKKRGYITDGKSDISAFSDKDDVSDWAYDAICWAKKAELLNGTSKTTLSPKAPTTRAQLAAILMRFSKYISK